MTDEPSPPAYERPKYFKLKEKASVIINKLLEDCKKGKVCIRANWPIRPELIPVSVAWILLLNSPPLPIYTPVCIKKVKFLAQEHNTMSPARARTQAARSGVERTKDEATANMTNPERPCFLYETKIYLDVLLTGEQCT